MVGGGRNRRKKVMGECTVVVLRDRGMEDARKWAGDEGKWKGKRNTKLSKRARGVLRTGGLHE